MRLAVHAGLIVAFITTLLLNVPTQAAPGVNATLSFQGRLLTSAGTPVPDGHYNIQFNLYQDGAGTTAGNPGGTLEWTETYTNNGGTSGVDVRNGVFSVNLGSKTPFGSSVDWNQDTLWLSMNVAGSATDCTTFDSGSCEADGEMLPMKRINSVPTAINSSQLGGKTANQFLQLAQGVQTDAGTNTNSIYVNKTGTGNLIQLQNTGTDVFTIGNNGSVTLGGESDKTISVAASGTETAGHDLSITAGNAGASENGANGGSLVLQGGNGSGTNGEAGHVVIDSGTTSGSGGLGYVAIGNVNAGGIVIGATDVATNQTISIGANNTAGSTTNITIGSGTASDGGTTLIRGKDGVTIAANGTSGATFSGNSNTLYLGNGETHNYEAAEDFTIQGTNSNVSGGSLTIQGGNGTADNADGGSVTIDGGTASGSGAAGTISIGTTNASSITIGKSSSNTSTLLQGTVLVKPTTGNDSTDAFQIQRANGTRLFVVDTANSLITLGSPASADKTVVSTGGKITKYGAARNTHTITLAAEYAGSVLDPGSGSNNTGTMTSGLNLSNRMNYYKWTTSQGSNQSYDVIVQVPIPQDFDGWASSNPLSITGYTSDTTNGTITLEARDSSNAVQCNFASATPASTSTWSANNTACTLSSGTYTPGNYMTLRIRMQSPNGGDVRIGNIKLDYLSKY